MMNKSKSIYFIQQLPQGCRQSLNSATKTRGLCCKAKFCREFDLLQCFGRLRWRQMDVLSYSIWISFIAAPSSRSHNILTALQWYTAGNLGSCTAAGTGSVCEMAPRHLEMECIFSFPCCKKEIFIWKEAKGNLSVLSFFYFHIFALVNMLERCFCKNCWIQICTVK